MTENYRTATELEYEVLEKKIESSLVMVAELINAVSNDIEKSVRPSFRINLIFELLLRNLAFLSHIGLEDMALSHLDYVEKKLGMVRGKIKNKEVFYSLKEEE